MLKLSAPIYALKSQAKALKRSRDISLSAALDEIARQEGFSTWSLLMAKQGNVLPECYSDFSDYLNPADMVVIAARPQMGKTTFAAGLIASAIETGPKTHFIFTLAERSDASRERIGNYLESGNAIDHCQIDGSDEISATYIISQCRPKISSGSLVVIDYLQMLDERRSNPPIMDQVKDLKSFARETGCIMIFLSQVDRAVSGRVDQRPGIDDIRLPNPLDLKLFNKIVLLFRDPAQPQTVEVQLAGKVNHSYKVTFTLVPAIFT